MGSQRAVVSYFFFFNDTATTEIYTLSLHDALPISVKVNLRELDSRLLTMVSQWSGSMATGRGRAGESTSRVRPPRSTARSEEHTSELQSRQYLVCRLLLEKKNHEWSQPSSRRPNDA